MNTRFWITSKFCVLCILFLKALEDDCRYFNICRLRQKGWVLILSPKIGHGHYVPFGWSEHLVRRQIFVQLYWNYNVDEEMTHLRNFVPAVQILANEADLDWKRILSGCTPGESAHLATQHFGFGRWLDIPRLDLGTAKRWLQVCDRDHQGESKLSTCTPIETGHSLNFPKLKFIDLQLNCIVQWTSTASPVYFALSYVWGSPDQAPHLKLTRDTSSRLLTPGGLDNRNNQIPCTIFDAMVLTRGLGRRYLWVDAICIQQDDALDKIMQIPLMATIYSQADCTVVAGAGANAWAGLPGVGRDRTGRQHTAHVKGFDLVTSRQHFREWMETCVWETRGWTLQERFCSRRMLIFTESQVFFECRSSLIYEDTNLESEAMNIGGSAGIPLYAVDRTVHPSSIYRSVVKDLSMRSFGLETDILNAFKGIETWLHHYSLCHQTERGHQRGFLVMNFHWGIPESIFDAVICWSFPLHNPSWRRAHQSFPGWCWAGWKFQPGLQFGTILHFYHPSSHLHVDVRFSWFVFDEDGRLRRLRTIPAPEKEPNTQIAEGQSGDQDEVRLEHIPAIPSNIPQSHLLFFWTTEAYLAVDQSGSEYSYRKTKDASLQNCRFAIRNPRTGDQVGEIVLHQEWRLQQPDKLPFVAVAKACDRVLRSSNNPDTGWYVMLIEWTDEIAHRVQMLEKPIQNEIWDSLMPQRRLVSIA